MIYLEDSQIALVQTIINQFIPNHKVMVFGSRATGRNVKPFSDLDLCILDDNKIDISTLSELKDAFSESLLPIKVDIVLWSHMDESFRKAVQPDFKPLVQTPNDLS
jgi:uncharacterized protein